MSNAKVILKDRYSKLGTLPSTHVYVKLSDRYTPTVRNLSQFRDLLNDPNEPKTDIKIQEVGSDVPPLFLEGVKDMIHQYKVIVELQSTAIGVSEQGLCVPIVFVNSNQQDGRR